MALNRLAIALIFILTISTSSFAKCPFDALSINVNFQEKVKGRKIYAEIENNLGIKRIELTEYSEGSYKGLLSYLTNGFTFIIEFNCNYFPKYMKIYIDEKLVHGIKLNRKKLELNADTNDSRYRNIYKVKVSIGDSY